MKKAMVIDIYGDGPVWHHFGLTYANYFVMPRRALCSMPLEWQERFVALMEEAEARLPKGTMNGNYWVRLKKGNKFIHDSLAEYRHAKPLPLTEARGRGENEGDQPSGT